MGTYADVRPSWGSGKSNMAGVQPFIYFAPIDDILTLQVPATSPVNEVDKFIIKTAHVMKSTKKFLTMYISEEKGRLNYEPLGGNDGGGYKATCTGFVAGDSDELNYFANMSRNDRFVVIVPDQDGYLNQLGGSGAHYAVIKLNKDTEVITGDAKGYNVDIMCYMPYKWKYDAAVPTTAAS